MFLVKSKTKLYEKDRLRPPNCSNNFKFRTTLISDLFRTIVRTLLNNSYVLILVQNFFNISRVFNEVS